MSTAEKNYFETNNLIVMNWKLSPSRSEEGHEEHEEDERKTTVYQKSDSDQHSKWSFSSLVDGFIGMYFNE